MRQPEQTGNQNLKPQSGSPTCNPAGRLDRSAADRSLTDRPGQPATALPRCRAFELDALRGLAVLMMVLHHMIFDLRYLFGLDVFAWQESNWFIYLLRPLFLSVFLLISGICSTFTRSNLKRGLRLGAVALGFTVATTIVSLATHSDLYIFFNVLHLLAVGILLYAALTWHDRGPRTDAILVLLTLATMYVALILPKEPVATWLLLPFGVLPAGVPTMSDYLPIFPWLGFFLAGALIGRLLYRDRQTAFPGAPSWLLNISAPFMFMGRNSLWIYALHQPIMLAILYGLRGLGLL